MCAMLSRDSPEFTRPMYSSMIFGLLPAAVMRVGVEIIVGIATRCYRIAVLIAIVNRFFRLLILIVILLLRLIQIFH